MADRRRIERAVGVLMGGHHLPEAAARAALLDTARARGQSLAQAADHPLDSTDPPS